MQETLSQPKILGSAPTIRQKFMLLPSLWRTSRSGFFNAYYSVDRDHSLDHMELPDSQCLVLGDASDIQSLTEEERRLKTGRLTTSFCS